MKLFLHRIIAWIVTFFMLVSGCLSGTNHWDLPADYRARISGIELYENTLETAQPQTKIYDLLTAHFKSALPEGKTAKKAIVIGYDGCRADLLSLTGKAEKSAIRTLLENGGHAVLSYCGGVNYPYLNTQATSTAPGWCSMLTGAWADVHGITDNGQEKSNDHLTLLTTLVQDGTVGASAFYVSWPGHFSGENTTYYREKQYIEQNKIAADFVCAADDAGTKQNVLTNLEQADCADFIFSIFEYCDHDGHATGFDLQNENYVRAFRESEQTGREILETIAARETFATEDWLVLITTDHGGFNRGHGHCTIQERYTFIVSNKEIA